MRRLRLTQVDAHGSLPHLNIFCFRRPFATALRLQEEEIYVNTRQLDETELHFLIDEFPPPPSVMAQHAPPPGDLAHRRLHRLEQRSSAPRRNVDTNPCSSLDWRNWLDEVDFSSKPPPLYPCTDGHDNPRWISTSRHLRCDTLPSSVKIARRSLSPHCRSAAVLQDGAWELVPNGSAFHLITGDTNHSVSWFGAELAGKGAHSTPSTCGGGQMLLQCLRAKYSQRSSISDRARIILSGVEGNRAVGSAQGEVCEETDERPQGKLSISPLWVALTDIRHLRLTLPLSPTVTCFYRYQCAAQCDHKTRKPKRTYDLFEGELGANALGEAADDVVTIKKVSRMERPATADQPPSPNIVPHAVVVAPSSIASPSIPDCRFEKLRTNDEAHRSCDSSSETFTYRDAAENYLKERQVATQPSISALVTEPHSVPAASSTSSVAPPLECPLAIVGVIKEHFDVKNNNCVSLVNFSRRSKW